MPRSSHDRVDFRLEAESARSPRVVEEDEPFRIVLAGDFGGRQRVPKAISIDRDNFDEVLESMGVEIDLPAGRLSIASIDHFHPDHIYTVYPAFHEMRDMRARLSDPATSSAAARELAGEEVPAPRPQPMTPPSGSLLDIIAGESGTAATPAVSAGGDLQDFLNRAMRPYLEEQADPRASELIGQVDEITCDLLRAILHQTRFQAIEAAWRTAFRLVRKLETGPELKVFLIDVSPEELAANPEEFYRALTRQPDPWALIAYNHAFGANELGRLQLMGRIAAKLNAPFLAEADGSLLGDPQWAAFRRTAEAGFVGLALPRVLLRMPYGAETDPTEVPGFEEIDGSPNARRALYGPPAFFVAGLLGESFAQYGWDFQPGVVREIAHLPMFTYEAGGETRSLPCADVELTESAAEALMDEGFIPLAAIRDSGVVRVLRFQSAAEPARSLPGKWG